MKGSKVGVELYSFDHAIQGFFQIELFRICRCSSHVYSIFFQYDFSDNIKDYLVQECIKKGTPCVAPSVVQLHVPRQKNTYDCGIFLLVNLEKLFSR